VASDLQNRWHQFWAVCIFRCAGASLEIPEIFPKIPDFPETPGKSPEYPSFTNKIVSPPSRRNQDHSNCIRAWCSDSSLTAWSLKMSTSCEVSFEHLRFDGSNYDCWSAHVLHVLHTWGSPFEQVVRLPSFPRIFIVRTRPTIKGGKGKCVP
jgi:hypothetical protein